MAKFIKLFSGTLVVAETAANKFIADNEPEIEFIEARPFGGMHGVPVEALVFLQYEADAPIAEDAPVTEVS